MDPKPPCRRRPRIVDRRLPFALLWKAVLQWLLFMAVAFGVLLAWRFLEAPDRPIRGHLRAIWEHHGAVFVVLAALLPVVVYDSFRFSHRLAGPMVRLRHTLHRLAQGQEVEPLKFRQRDYWHDVADDFNAVMARLETRLSDSAAPRGEAVENATSHRQEALPRAALASSQRASRPSHAEPLVEGRAE